MKIRGYRIELTEIESVLLELPQIAQAAVITHEPEPGLTELAAYYSLKQGVSDLPRSEISEALRSRLPAYMVPAYLEQLPLTPMTVSNKADHKKLPKPKGPRFTAVNGSFVAPRGETEEFLVRQLAEVLKVERVSAGDNFFKDLGAHSLLMARFCARIRKRPGLSAVSMRDIYFNPTVARLAAHLGAVALAESAVAQDPVRPFRIPSDLEYYGCGALQLMFYAGYGLLGLWTLSTGLIWTHGAIDNLGELYLRGLALVLAMFFGLTAIPIALKWLLIGKWKEEVIPIWSLPLLPLLGGQDFRSKRADGRICRHPDLPRHLAHARRQDRTQCGHQLPLRPGLHRPVLDRRQHDPAQGLRSCSATRRRATTSTPGRSGSATTHTSVWRAYWTSIRSWKTGPNSATRRPCRAVNVCLVASIIMALRRRRQKPTIAPSRPGTAARSGVGFTGVCR